MVTSISVVCILPVMKNILDLSVDAARASVKTVVVPAAGMGTRFLPATKTVPCLLYTSPSPRDRG